MRRRILNVHRLRLRLWASVHRLRSVHGIMWRTLSRNLQWRAFVGKLVRPRTGMRPFKETAFVAELHKALG